MGIYEVPELFTAYQKLKGTINASDAIADDHKAPLIQWLTAPRILDSCYPLFSRRDRSAYDRVLRVSRAKRESILFFLFLEIRFNIPKYLPVIYSRFKNEATHDE